MTDITTELLHYADELHECSQGHVNAPDVMERATTEITTLRAANAALKQMVSDKDGLLTALRAERDAAARDASRYRWLRERDLDTIDQGGVFAGRTSKSGRGGVVINLEDLDREVDAAVLATEGKTS